MADLWCVLRMSGASTLPLFHSLREAGYEVWTPVETQFRQRPRTKAKHERDVPIMPTYIFARAEQLPSLLALSDRPGEHRDFSLFHQRGRGFPLIADASLEALREEENGLAARVALQRRKASKPVFAPGEKVKVPDGGFHGLPGIVETTHGNFVMVCFPGFSTPIKVASWHIVRDDVGSPSKFAA